MEQKLLRVGAVADFKFDFAPLTNAQIGADSDWLGSGETIASATVVIESGVTLDSDSLTDSNTSVTCWLSGALVAGDKYRLQCQIVTSAGRTEPRSMMIKIIDKHD